MKIIQIFFFYLDFPFINRYIFFDSKKRDVRIIIPFFIVAILFHKLEDKNRIRNETRHTCIIQMKHGINRYSKDNNSRKLYMTVRLSQNWPIWQLSPWHISSFGKISEVPIFRVILRVRSLRLITSSKCVSLILVPLFFFWLVNMFILRIRVYSYTKLTLLSFMPHSREKIYVREGVSTSQRRRYSLREIFFRARQTRKRNSTIVAFQRTALANLIIRKSSPPPREGRKGREIETGHFSKWNAMRISSLAFSPSYYYHYFIDHSETSSKVALYTLGI